ncbi:MAG: hypothetical protein QW429_07055 [Thermoprotei archaeon]
MVSEMIDYVAAAVGIVIVFLAGIFIFGNMVSNGIAYSQQENTILGSQSLFDYILLSPGSPANWGSTAKPPLAFGLADYASAQPYTLSASSVMRLLESSFAFQSNTVTYHGKTYINLTNNNFSALISTSSVLNYTYIKQLLDINGQYEFYLTLQPAIAFKIHKLQTTQGTAFSVSLTNYQGLPLAGAQLAATLIYQTQNSLSVYLASASSTTNLSGVAILEFNQQPAAFDLIVQATVAGLTGWGYYTNITPSKLEAYALIQPGADNITLVQHCALITTPSCGVDQFNASELVPSGLNEFEVVNLTCTRYTLNAGRGVGNVHKSSDCFAILPKGFIVVAIQQVGKGQQSRVFLEIFPMSVALGNMDVAFGLNPVVARAVSVTTLTRLVNIDGVSYVATFAYWPDYGQVYGGFP